MPRFNLNVPHPVILNANEIVPFRTNRFTVIRSITNLFYNNLSSTYVRTKSFNSISLIVHCPPWLTCKERNRYYSPLMIRMLRPVEPICPWPDSALPGRVSTIGSVTNVMLSIRTSSYPFLFAHTSQSKVALEIPP